MSRRPQGLECGCSHSEPPHTPKLEERCTFSFISVYREPPTQGVGLTGLAWVISVR